MTQPEDFRRMKDEFFAADPESPLTPKQRRGFKGLRYFRDNPALRLEVTVEEFPNKDAIEMQTTTGDRQHYVRYGKFRFIVDGKLAELTIFQGEHGFFLPFTDELAGKETYGAGRYLEPEPLAGNQFRVDFNAAYNPYCAYNDRWSCPITPRENRLQVPVRAGEKVFHS